MNASYRSIWNATLGTWVAASEITSARGRRASPPSDQRGGRAMATLALILLAAAGGAQADTAVGGVKIDNAGGAICTTVNAPSTATSSWTCQVPNGSGGFATVSGIPSGAGGYPDAAYLNNWVATHLGGNSIAWGTTATKAIGADAIAIGRGAVAGANALDASIAIGTGSGSATARNSYFLGSEAGKGASTNGVVGIGLQAAMNSSASSSVLIGANAGSASSGDGLAGAGTFALQGAEGSYNTGLGYGAGRSTSGDSNTAVGFNAGGGTQGKSNVAMGDSAGMQTTGRNNVAVGTMAGGQAYAANAFLAPLGLNYGQLIDGLESKAYTLDASGNVVNSGSGAVVLTSAQIGQLFSVTPPAASGTVSVGSYAGGGAGDAIAIGTNARAGGTGAVNDTGGAAGVRAIAIGKDASSTMASSIAMGYGATAQNTAASTSNPASAIAIGTGAAAMGNRTIAIGSQAGAGGSGYDNLALGVQAGQNNAGRLNTAIGLGAGSNIGAAATDNVAIGNRAGVNVNAAPTPFADYLFGQGHNVAIGTAGFNVTGDVNVAVGQLAGRDVTGSSNSAMGLQSGWFVVGDRNLALGQAAGGNLWGSNNVAIGRAAGQGLNSSAGTPGVNRTVSVGDAARAYGNDSIAMGTSAEAGVKDSADTVTNAVAIGNGAKATGASSISIGTGNVVGGARSGAIGDPSYINADDSYAIGNNNTINASARQSFVLGNGVTVNNANNVVLGNASADRAVMQVNSATVPTTIATLNPDGTVTYTAGPVLTYGNFAGASQAAGVVSVGSATATRQIVNLAPGEISATSTDAVNGSQLFSLATTVTAMNGNITNIVNNAGSHFYSVNGGTNADGNYANNGATAPGAIASGIGASASAANSVAMGTGASATTANSVALGANSTTGATTSTMGTTLQGTSYAFAGGTSTGVVSVGSAGGERQLTNVAAGQLHAGSTDAVNGSQLYATNQAINNLSIVAGAGIHLTTSSTGTGIAVGTSVAHLGPGGTATYTAGNNVVLTQSGTQTTFAVNDNPNFNSVTVGTTSIASNGVSIADGPSMTTAGVNAGGKTLTNVAPGVHGTDAVNVNQLNAGLGVVNNNLHSLRQDVIENRREAQAGVAGAMAMTGMPQAYLPGKSMLAAGAASFKGQTAIAIGLSKISDNGRWVTKITGSANTRGDVGVAVGAGYQW